MSDLPYWRGAFADVCSRIVDVVEGDTDTDPTLYQLEADLRVWWLESRADGFPARASGAEPSPGATNVVHEFDGVTLTVPQHSDPTGEVVAGRPDDEKLKALCVAWDQLQEGAALVAKARTTIRKALLAPEKLDTEIAEARSRTWCWSCLRVRLETGERCLTDVYRERTGVNGEPSMPLCRNCHSWVASHDEELPPPAVVKVWANHERLTTRKLRELNLDDDGNRLPARRPTVKAKRKRRR